MRAWALALGIAAALSASATVSTARADDRNPDLIDRLGRAIQNNDAPRDRDRGSAYGGSGYDRDRRDAGRDSHYSDEQRRIDDEQRELDRRRRALDQRRGR
jgi:hypothetical protein